MLRAVWLEAILERALQQVELERISDWMLSDVPRRNYPAVAIGSPNGAAVHLCAALDVPWLPQTSLILVRRIGFDRDDFTADMEWGRKTGRKLLERNPDLQLYHMTESVCSGALSLVVFDTECTQQAVHC